MSGLFNKPERSESRWLSVNEIRKQQRCRKEKVLAAMNSGQLPYEQRGRIRYARQSDIAKWEESRLRNNGATQRLAIHRDLLEFI